MAFNLKLPDERGKQLQMIAEKEGKSVVDVITDHIRSKIAEGVIPADLPMVAINKTGDGVQMVLPGFKATVPLRDILKLTDALRGGPKHFMTDPEGKERLVSAARAFVAVQIKGMAQGIKLVSSVDGAVYPLTTSVAEDLADQIERVVK